jgi:hypothetical protein
MTFPLKLNRWCKSAPFLTPLGLVIAGVSFLVLAPASLLSQSAQSDRQNRDLFTSYFPIETPLFKAHIPAPACEAIIRQADSIVATLGGLKKLDEHDLSTASDNLRVCATSSELARFDRDLAIGLYGEVVSEKERREREKASNRR